VLWYNPNLYPEEEYFRRLETQKELLCKMGLSEQVGLLVLPWQSEKYYKAVAGYENEPEGGRRCEKCFELRLQECARIAKSGNFDYFCSTLTVSRHKNAVLINRIGENEGEKEEVCWLPSDFKKHNGENRSVELSEKYGIYRQVYCGCEFSLKARMQPKKQELTERKDTENE
jgi:predicted adenine nucleotide alpha hydrolase (AANH) superfamily ATPase